MSKNLHPVHKLFTTYRTWKLHTIYALLGVFLEVVQVGHFVVTLFTFQLFLVVKKTVVSEVTFVGENLITDFALQLILFLFLLFLQDAQRDVVLGI